MIRQTHTYAILEVSQATYDEIKEGLEKAEYNHAFHRESSERIVIDMHGIAVAADPTIVRKEVEKEKDESSTDHH